MTLALSVLLERIAYVLTYAIIIKQPPRTILPRLLIDGRLLGLLLLLGGLKRRQRLLGLAALDLVREEWLDWLNKTDRRNVQLPPL